MADASTTDFDRHPLMDLHRHYLRTWLPLVPASEQERFRAHALAMLGVARACERRDLARQAAC